jgi:hypothetical protein
MFARNGVGECQASGQKQVFVIAEIDLTPRAAGTAGTL